MPPPAGAPHYHTGRSFDHQEGPRDTGVRAGWPPGPELTAPPPRARDQPVGNLDGRVTDSLPGSGPWGWEFRQRAIWGLQSQWAEERSLEVGGMPKPLALPSSLGVGPLSSRDVTIWYQMPKSKPGPSAVTPMTPDRKGPWVPHSQLLPALASALPPTRLSSSQDQRRS